VKLTRYFLQTLSLVAVILLSLQTVTAAKSHHDTLSLDGKWQIIFDRDNDSKSKKLYQNTNFLAQKDIQEITVPSVWERLEQDYEGVAVYRRTFNAPKSWKNKITHLSFDAVNYRAEVYLNDNVVGVHEGGFTPFSFRIDSMLKFDQKNIITLRVLGPILLETDKVIDGMGAMETPQWRGGITGGIWQSVRLVVSEKSYINDIFIEPNLKQNQAKITLSTTNFESSDSNDSIKFVVTESKTGKVVANKKITITMQPGKNQWQGVIDIPKAKSWSPDTPNLYTLKASISRNGKVSDKISERFGMREFTVANKRFYLNGKEIYVKAAFLEGVYPVGIASPVDLELARKEIRLAKEAGFNMLRPWRRPPTPEWLDLADEMGIFVVGSPALECMDLPVSTPDLPNRVINELTQTILRDRNRASIVLWELYNEVRRPILKQMMAETAMMARDLDPSRLILDESGGWAFGAKVYLPYERNFVHFNDVHTYPGPNVTNAWYDRFLGVAYTKKQRQELGITGNPIGSRHKQTAGAASFVSELGYGSYVNFSKVNKAFNEKGNPIVPAMRDHAKLADQLTKVITEELSDIYPVVEEFYLEQQHIHGLANARMIEATRSNPNVTGYCVHALTGGDWVLGAGLLDLWRNPKQEVYERTKAANQSRILTIRTFPRNVYAGRKMRFNVKGINDIAKTKGKLALKIESSDGKTIWGTSTTVSFEHSISELFNHEISTSGLNGNYKISAEITDNNGQMIAANSYDFNVVEPSVDKEIATIAVVDKVGSLTTFLKKNNINFKNFSDTTDINSVVFVALAQGKGKHKQQKSINKRLSAFAKKGGTVAYIQFPYIGPKWTDGVLSKGYALNLPFPVKMKASTGLWGGMSHIAPNHPVFKGLPSKQAMHGIYENVRAKISMVGLDAKPIITLIANDNFPDMTLMKRHYKGTGDVWVGSDLSEVKHGKGKLLLSTMQIVPHLNKDPVADKLLGNILSYLTKKQ